MGCRGGRGPTTSHCHSVYLAFSHEAGINNFGPSDSGVYHIIHGGERDRAHCENSCFVRIHKIGPGVWRTNKNMDRCFLFFPFLFLLLAMFSKNRKGSPFTVI